MNRNEYNSCVTEYADGLFRFIFKSMQQKEMAEDIVQNSFETLWLHHQEVEMAKAKSYLFTVAYRKMIDEIRKNKRTISVSEHHENMSQTEPNIQFDTKKIIHHAINTLPDIQKQLIMLKDHEGYNYEEMASITGLNLGQIKISLFRARTTLKKQLSGIYHPQA